MDETLIFCRITLGWLQYEAKVVWKCLQWTDFILFRTSMGSAHLCKLVKD
jgi:hypothetical protein